MSNNPSPVSRTTNLPIYSLITAVTLIALGVLVLIFVPSVQTSQGALILFGLIGTSVPALLSAGYAERTNRDVRNGVVKDSVVAGTHQALQEAQIVTRDGPTMKIAMEAIPELLALLKSNTAATAENTTATQTATNAVQVALPILPEPEKHP